MYGIVREEKRTLNNMREIHYGGEKILSNIEMKYAQTEIKAKSELLQQLMSQPKVLDALSHNSTVEIVWTETRERSPFGLTRIRLTAVVTPHETARTD